MLFASTSLAARIERAECRLLADSAASAARRRPGTDVFATPLAGGLRLSEGVAHLCGAATLPGHRRRGVQSALLAARLEIPAGAGCDVAVVITQPGSKSQSRTGSLVS